MAQHACLQADVVVLGGGPAGATAALNLAPSMRVLVVDKRAGPGSRIGESLPAAAGRLLRDMGLEQAFLRQAHLPCHLTRSTWGSAAIVEQDALRNLDGPGWHLDRERFDDWLLAVAQERGAAVLAQARLASAQRDGDGWVLGLERTGRPLRVEARFVIDASGRNSSFARQCGARRIAGDKLVCGWLFGTGRPGPGAGSASELHAELDGWWYWSPLPGGRRLLAFYTDADLPAAVAAHDAAGLMQRARGVGEVRRMLEENGFAAGSEHGFCAANGAALEPASDAGWLAVGDAALTFDPLSSQGLFNALYTGLAGAEATHRQLDGDGDALRAYRAELQRIHAAYSAHLGAWYGHERRWPDSPFWLRRHRI